MNDLQVFRRKLDNLYRVHFEALLLRQCQENANAHNSTPLRTTQYDTLTLAKTKILKTLTDGFQVLTNILNRLAGMYVVEAIIPNLDAQASSLLVGRRNHSTSSSTSNDTHSSSFSNRLSALSGSIKSSPSLNAFFDFFTRTGSSTSNVDSSHHHGNNYNSNNYNSSNNYNNSNNNHSNISNSNNNNDSNGNSHSSPHFPPASGNLMLPTLRTSSSSSIIKQMSSEALTQLATNSSNSTSASVTTTPVSTAASTSTTPPPFSLGKSVSSDYASFAHQFGFSSDANSDSFIHFSHGSHGSHGNSDSRSSSRRNSLSKLPLPPPLPHSHHHYSHHQSHTDYSSIVNTAEMIAYLDDKLTSISETLYHAVFMKILRLCYLSVLKSIDNVWISQSVKSSTKNSTSTSATASTTNSGATKQQNNVLFLTNKLSKLYSGAFSRISPAEARALRRGIAVSGLIIKFILN